MNAARALALALACSSVACGELDSGAQLGAGAEVPRAGPARIDAEVERAIEAKGRARVLVVLRVAELPGARARSLGDAEALARASSPIAATGDALLARMPASTVVERRFSLIEAMALSVDAGGLRALAEAPEVEAVSLDPGGAEHMVEAGELGGFTQLTTQGHAGAGMRIAVIDSGVDVEHPDFGARVVDEACFCTGCCPSGADTQLGPGSVIDDRGHGTNVAGIAASGGVVAPAGAAPELEVVAVKVLDEHGGFCCISDVIAAIDWVLQTHPEVAAINTSFGSVNLYPGHCRGTAWLDVIEALAEVARANDIVMVASTGNSGREDRMSAPACIEPFLAVAATWDADFGEKATKECVDDDAYVDHVACFSNLSAALDLFAPGISILAPARGGGTTSAYEGTSQAAPQVSACAALIRAAHPGISTAALEAALRTSNVAIDVPALGVAIPRLQCDVALNSIPDEPESTDTGVDTGADMGSGSGGVTLTESGETGPSLDQGEGCACDLGGPRSPSRSPWLLLVPVVLARRVRRRAA